MRCWVHQLTKTVFIKHMARTLFDGSKFRSKYRGPQFMYSACICCSTPSTFPASKPMNAPASSRLGVWHGRCRTKELSELGRGFANLKAMIETRPRYHGGGDPSRNRSSNAAGLGSDKTLWPCQRDQWFCAKLSNMGYQPQAQNGKAAQREAGGRRDAAVCPSRKQNGTHAIL